MKEVIVMSNVNIRGIIEKVMGHTLSYMDDMIIDYEGVERSDFFWDNVDPLLDEILTYHKVEFYDDLYEDNPNVDDLHALKMPIFSTRNYRLVHCTALQ